MSERIQIQELRLHTFGGKFPEISTYEHVDIPMLTQGDVSPLFVTLPIAEVGRVSGNGLVYDEALVSTIAEQVQQGVDGIRGHLRDDQADTAFPVADVYWVGSSRVGDVLWCKGYIPPGANKEDIIRRKATRGGIGTSIYGDALKETLAEQTNGRKHWRARDFRLLQLDLAPSKRAALQFDKGFKVTAEMQDSEAIEAEENIPMPEADKKQIISELTVNDIPSHLKEQLIREAKVQADAARVSELTTKVSELETQVQEMATYKSIVTEIRGTLNKDTDTVQIVAEYHTMATKLAELLGVPYTNISVRVEEMYSQVAEFKRKTFEGAVDGKVAEMTPWTPRTDDGKKKVSAFRNAFKRAVVSELKGATEDAKIAETVKTLWDSEFQLLSGGLVAELAGGPAIVAGKGTSDKPKLPTEAEIAAARAKTGI